MGDAGNTRTDQGLVADEPEGKADQDRREGRQPRPLRRIPDGAVAIPSRMFQAILRPITELHRNLCLQAGMKRSIVMCS